MQPYRPALRFKQGEYRAAHALPPDMKKYLRPYFIVPPPKESDPELGRAPTADEIGYLLGERLGKFWPLAPAYLDTQYVAASLGEGGLRRLLQTSRRRNNRLIAAVRSADLIDPFWREFISATTPRLAVHLPFEDFDPDSMKEGIKELGISAQDCEVFVDFTGAELDPDISTDAIAGTLEAVAGVAPWGAVIFQASNFPTTNPAEDGKTVEVPRHEWEIFRRLLANRTIPAGRLGFSDFGADCGRIAFRRSSGGGPPIRHIRYSTERSVVVVRGTETGNQGEVMRGVFGRVVSHPDFAGKAFSPADRQLWEASKNLVSPSNASTWRQMNMTHHMARVLRDLGQLTGLSFADGSATTEPVQVPLFSDLAE